MKLIIDTEAQTLTTENAQGGKSCALHSVEAFEELSKHWVNVGWSQKYSYTFSWMGRPIIQLPEDMVRIQEVIYAIKPDVIIETGVAHGGSLIFYASLCQAMGKGHIVGIDIEIRPHNRAAIETHEMFERISLIEGSSVAPEIVAQAAQTIQPGDTTLVILDSDHSKAHVMAELDAYAPLVSVGSYIVATDGIMEMVAGAPRAKAEWTTDNARQAALEWAGRNPNFALVEPAWPFNESELSQRITHWPDAFLQRVS